MSITTPVLIPVPFCNSGNKATIPGNTPTSPDEANYASYEAGFPPITMIPTEANGIPPRGVDFNGILYVISSNIQNWNAGVQMKFNSDFCTAIGGYPRGAVLQADDNSASYVSAIDNNTGDFNGNPELIGTDWLLYGGGGNSIRFAVAGGSSDIITVTYENPVTELTDGMIVCFQATAANVTTTPSFNPDGLGAVTIVKGANQPLSEGDISGEGYLAILQYSVTWNKWILQNPATGINIVIPSTMPVGAIYVQFAGQADPTTLFGGTWENVSATYAGLFFRAEGGAAAAFGSTQTDGAPNITGTASGNDIYSDLFDIPLSNLSGAFLGTEMVLQVSTNSAETGTVLRTFSIDASRSNAVYTANEVRPANSTIRIWKRTA
mgnify:CR=1 FL=1